MLRAYGDGNLFGELYGEGPIRVVFLHGWARQGQDFATVATALAERGIASVALDFPGFGSSPLPSTAGGARHYSDLIVDALRAMSDQPLVLVGHSFGGRVATVVAARHPELVRALVMTGAPLVRKTSSRKAPLGYRVAKWLNVKGLVSDERMEVAKKKHGSADYRNADGIMRDILVATVNESYEEELSKVAAPVWLVWGSDDRDVPVSVANEAMTHLGGASTLRVIEGVGHLLPVSSPTSLLSAIEEALS